MGDGVIFVYWFNWKIEPHLGFAFPSHLND